MNTDSTERWKRPESVLVLVYAASGEVLLLQRADDPAFWQSITGSLETGETPLDTARRELLEETGLACEPHDRGESSRFEIRGLWRPRYAPGVTHNLEHVFTVRLEAPCDVTLAPDEHLAWRWMAAPEALALTASASNARAIRTVVIEGDVSTAGATVAADDSQALATDERRRS